MKKLLAFSSFLAFGVVATVAIGVCQGNSSTILASQASATRSMVFNYGNNEVTTEDGNHFKAELTTANTGAALNANNALANLTVTSSWSSYSFSFSVSPSVLTFVGDYAFSHVSSIVISYNMNADYSYLNLILYDGDGSSSYTSIRSTYAERGGSGTFTYQPANHDNSYSKFAISLSHDSQNGGNGTQNTYIYSLTINYLC